MGMIGVLIGGTGCSSKAPSDEMEHAEKIDLTFWNPFTGPDGKIMQQIVDGFNAKYEGKIEVSTNVFSSESYYPALSSAMIGGTAPDICMVHCSRIAKFAQKDQLCTLEYMITELGYAETDFLPAAWENGTFKGKRYGIPMDIHQLGLYYNDDLMQTLGIQELPETMGEFIAAAKLAARDQDGDGEIDTWGFAIDPSVMSEQMFLSFLYQFGGDAFSEDKSTAVYDSRAGVQALTLMKDMIYTYQTSPAGISLDSAVTMFEEGKLLFYANGPWMLSELNEIDGLNFGITTFPQLGMQAGVWADSHNVVIPVQKKENEKKMEAIQMFVQYLLQHESDWAKAGHVPALKAVLESEEYQRFEEMKPFWERLDTAKILWGAVHYEDYIGILAEYIQKVLANDMEVEAALEAAVRDGKNK